MAAELAQVFYMAAARAQAYEVRCQSWVDEPEPDDNVSDSHVTFVFADEATQESRFAWSCHVNSDPVTEEQVREAFKRFSLQDQQPNRLPGCPRCFNPDVRRERTIGREVQSVTHSCPRCWWRWTESHPLPPPTKRP